MELEEEKKRRKCTRRIKERERETKRMREVWRRGSRRERRD